MRRDRALILTTCLFCCCLDTSLSDEVNWPDGGLSTPDGSSPDPADRDGGAPVDAAQDSWALDGSSDALVDDTTPPWLVSAGGCAEGESPIGALCSASGPLGIALRLWASEPVIASAHVSGSDVDVRCETPGVEHHLLLAPLTPATDLEVTVEVVDRAGLSAAEGPLSLRTASLVAPVVINEALFDPLGDEPHQEFVELANIGTEAVDLEGWTIEDEGGADTLSSTGLIGPGGFAVIVSDQYQPGVGGDPPPAAGALMIRLDGAIGSQGLRNSGEALTLRDAAGQLVSKCPAVADAPDPGTSIERVFAYAPDADAANWQPNSSATSTPGGANSVSGSGAP